jgi:hypothetical protein
MLLNPEPGKPITGQSLYTSIPSRISEIGMNEIARRQAKEMNVLSTTRIGWEQKQKYIDWLTQMYTEDYLTEEEYNARMEFLQASRSEEEIKLAFHDLPRLRPTGMESIDPTRRVVTPTPRRHTVRYAAGWFIFGLIMMVSAGIGHDIPLLLADSLLTVVWGVILGVRMSKIGQR